MKEINHDAHYFDNSGQELFQSKSFNPVGDCNNFYGLSKLVALYYEIEQYNKAGAHNLSLLLRGGKLTGIFEVEIILV